jgi:hypothetical protein
MVISWSFSKYQLKKTSNTKAESTVNSQHNIVPVKGKGQQVSQHRPIAIVILQHNGRQ